MAGLQCRTAAKQKSRPAATAGPVHAQGLPVGSGISRALWERCQPEFMSCLHHPFVRGLADGTLPRAAFQHYVVQDEYFLRAFAKAYALALVQADTAGSAAVLQQLLDATRQELKLHAGYAQEWAVDLKEQSQPSAATQAYCNFLLDVALHQSIPHILAAMAPCSRLYGYIGCQLAAGMPHQMQSPYRDWVATYSSAEYLQAPAAKERLLDELSMQQPPGSLQRLYSTAMQMEVDFFSGQPDTPQPPRIGLLVVDFDETCTASDSTGRVIETAIAAAEQRAGPDGDAVRQRLELRRDGLVAGYAKQRQAFLQRVLPQDGASSDFDMQRLSDFIDELSEFDREMNKVVLESRILAGVVPGMLRKAGAGIALQPGCLPTLQRAQRAGVPLHVLSVSWSAEMVRGALERAIAVSEQSEKGSPKGRRGAVVHANELAYRDNLSTGGMVRNVECGVDKADVLDRLLLQAAGTRSAGGLSVYIGDSPSDLAPLLAADLGIVVGKSSSLQRAAAHGGVSVKPLVAVPSSGKAPEGTLFVAESWHAIEALLFGPDPMKAITPPAAPHSPSRSTNQGIAASSSQPNGMPQPTQKGSAAVSLSSSSAGNGTQLAGRSDGRLSAGLGVQIPRVLTIAGSDSGGGAGIQADLKTFQARGVFGASAITALTAQNTHGVRGVHTAPAGFLAQQIDAVLEDVGADVVKTGMLPSAEAVQTVADRVRAHRVAQLVVDPVLVATSGHSLAESGVAQALKDALFPLATIITPNLPEASALLGGRPIKTLQDMQQAARDLHRLGPRYVLIKGGHLTDTQQLPGDVTGVAGAGQAGSSASEQAAAPSQPAGHSVAVQHSPPAGEAGQGASSYAQQAAAPPLQTSSSAREQQQSHPAATPQAAVDGDGSAAAASRQRALASDKPASPAAAIDVLYDGQQVHVLQQPRVSTSNTHGTGCTLASAIAAELARGQPPLVAVWRAKQWLTRLLAASAALQVGSGVQRPMHHAFEITDWAAEGAASQPVRPVLDLRLYAVTDPGCNARWGRSNAEAVRQVIAGGATTVQLREKGSDGAAFCREAAAVVAAARLQGVAVIINDRVDVALASGADGAHVGQDDMPTAAARRLLGLTRLLGVSVKTVEQAVQAQADGADYIGAGAVFPTGTKDSAVIGLDALAGICRAVSIPVVAIGGLSAANAGQAIHAGCAGVAVVSAVFAAESPQAVTTQLRSAVDQALQQCSTGP